MALWISPLMPLNPLQETQEAQYGFPYHYLDLGSEHHRLVIAVEYLSLLKRVKALVQPFEGQSVLDAGCGDGRFCYELRGQNVRVTGVDYSERALSFARAFNPGVTFHHQPLEALDLPGNFDVITMIEVLEHIPLPLLPRVTRCLAGQLADSGRLIVTVPSKLLPLSPKHEQHFDEASLRATLEPNFVVESIGGYARLGWERTVYRLLRQAAAVIYAPSVALPALRPYFDFLAAFYERFAASGAPAESRGLVAVCRKRPPPAE